MTRHRLAAFVAAPVTALVLVALVWRAVTGPGVVLLLPRGGADWVRPDRPFDLGVRVNAPSADTFDAAVPPTFAGGTLAVAGLTRVAVSVDGRPVLGPNDPADWQTDRSITLAPGPHQLRLTVTNPAGPAVVRPRCDGIATWRTADGRAAIPVSMPWRPPLADRYGPSLAGLWRSLPWLAAVFAVATWTASRSRADWGRRARWAVLAAWVVLAVADLTRVPLSVGYDAAFHVDYIRYVADHARLPPPDGGVQFFQAPLYYLISAALWRTLAAAGVVASQLPFLMRLIPLACGATLADVCYRTARAAFPGRPAAHAVAVVVGGLMPVNLYMGLAASNEPTAALLGGCVALAAVRFVTRPAERTEPRRLIVAGVLLGLAVLAKLTAGLWAIPLAVAVRRPRSAGVVLLVAAAVSGPWFARTWVATGSPVVSHTVLAGATWWQDPGYRTPGQLLPSGRGLTCVAYGGTDSLWDSLYSTAFGNGYLSGTIGPPERSPFHLDAMGAGLWLGLVPVGLLVAGAVAWRPPFSDGPEARPPVVPTEARPSGPSLNGRDPMPFARLSVALFVVAVAWVYLTLPIYSCGKASYALSTLPCVGLLAAAGFDRVRGRWPRAVAVGLLAAWAAAAYGTYVVLG